MQAVVGSLIRAFVDRLQNEQRVTGKLSPEAGQQSGSAELGWQQRVAESRKQSCAFGWLVDSSNARFPKKFFFRPLSYVVSELSRQTQQWLNAAQEATPKERAMRRTAYRTVKGAPRNSRNNRWLVGSVTLVGGSTAEDSGPFGPKQEASVDLCALLGPKHV
ncbi:hypothetical protein VTI74DRAFT_11577 [Chaetomium olivicolor]